MRRVLIIMAAQIVVILSLLAIGQTRLTRYLYGTEISANSTALEKSAYIDELMEPFTRDDSPGAVVMVIKDGRVVHEKGYGQADLRTKEPIQSDTRFELASVSKQFTAMAVMILAERGKLGYEDSLAKFFPQLPAYARTVTVRHLLNHTSGLPDAVRKLSEKKPEGVELTSHAILDYMPSQQEVYIPPGDRFEYNNSGYVLLSLIVEKASGMPFPRFVKENIFDPLEMRDSLVYDETKPDVQKLATSYNRAGRGFVSFDADFGKYIYGGKGVISSARDLYKWDQALFTEKLVKSSSIEQAFTPPRLNDGKLSEYGFGWGVGNERGVRFVGHTGGYLGYTTIILRYPDRRLTVVMLSNLRARAEPMEQAKKIARIYLTDKQARASVVNRRDFCGVTRFAPPPFSASHAHLQTSAPGKPNPERGHSS